MDQPRPADRPAREQHAGDLFPPSLEANEADVHDQEVWSEADDTEEGTPPIRGLEADEADLAEQARAVPADDDEHDRDQDRDLEY